MKHDPQDSDVERWSKAMDAQLRGALEAAIEDAADGTHDATLWWDDDIGRPIDKLLARLTEIVVEHKSAEHMEMTRQRSLVSRAITGLKHLGRFRYEPGDEPHSLDCSLAGRVSRIFGMGMTRATLLCRQHGEDPHFIDNREEEEDVQNVE